jgi:hypothetical protein
MTRPEWLGRLATAGVIGWFVRRQLAVIVVDPPDRDGVVIDARDRFGRGRPPPGLTRRRTGVNEEWNPRRHAGTWT